jgi:hypothetical protein
MIQLYLYSLAAWSLQLTAVFVFACSLELSAVFVLPAAVFLSPLTIHHSPSSLASLNYYFYFSPLINSGYRIPGIITSFNKVVLRLPVGKFSM